MKPRIRRFAALVLCAAVLVAAVLSAAFIAREIDHDCTGAGCAIGDQAQNAEAMILLGNGVALHSYQPTAEDMRKISECDLFVYAGGESDARVKGLTQTLKPPFYQKRSPRKTPDSRLFLLA